MVSNRKPAECNGIVSESGVTLFYHGAIITAERDVVENVYSAGSDVIHGSADENKEFPLQG